MGKAQVKQNKITNNKIRSEFEALNIYFVEQSIDK